MTTPKAVVGKGDVGRPHGGRMGVRVDGKAMGKQGTYPLKAAVSGKVSSETETRNIGNGLNPKRSH